MFALLSTQFFAQADTAAKKRNYYPNLATVQFAGNIGLFSIGGGYSLFRHHYQAEILYGNVPSMHSIPAINTIAFKNLAGINFTLKRLVVQPYLGFTFNYETGSNSFAKLPDKYTAGYYQTTSFHFTFFAGIKARMKLAKQWLIEPYIETGTVDTFLWYEISEKEINPGDVFSAALGVNFIFTR